MAELQYGIILHSFSLLSNSTKHPLDTLDKVNEGHVEEVDQIINKIAIQRIGMGLHECNIRKEIMRASHPLFIA